MKKPDKFHYNDFLHNINKLTYDQVINNVKKIKLNRTGNKSGLSADHRIVIEAIVDSINENIEPSWKGKKIKFINPVFILGPLKKRHSFEEGEIHKCVQDCGDSVNILIDGEFVEIFKESVYLCEKE